VIALLGLVLTVITSIAGVVTAYQLMAGLNSRRPALWAIGMFVPLLNIFLLLSVSSSAQQ
jgi:hypothetical protein